MIDVGSDTWMAVVASATSRLTDARKELESSSVEERRADFLRGVISALQDIIEQPTKSTPPVVENQATFF